MRPPIVDFVIAGVQKAGTTALYEFLGQHPDVVTHLAATKEAHVFDDERAFDGVDMHGDARRAYEGLFPATAGVVGEVTPILTYWRPCVARMRRYNPAMRVIVLLRDPVRRAYSHWNMEVRRGKESLAFDEAVRAEAERLAGTATGQHRVHSYVDRGWYEQQARRLLDSFPAEQCLFLRSEDLRDAHDATLGLVLRFIGVTDDVVPPPRSIHVGRYETAIDPGLERSLRATFTPDLALTQDLTGLDLRRWMLPTRDAPAEV